MLPVNEKHVAEPTKSWKKINEERKALKRKRKQEKLLKEHELLQSASDEHRSNVVSPTPSATDANRIDLSTISIAVPGSILENAQSSELCAYVAGQIARAACIFRVNEVIVFDDVGLGTARETRRDYAAETAAAEHHGAEDAVGEGRTVRSSSLQLARILQYLECPQYLRKFFFPLHKHLKYSGLLNPLDAPHHLRQQSAFPYREGVVSEKPAKPGHSFVNAGLLNDVLVDTALEAGVRVTVKLNKTDQKRKMRGKLVGPDEPRRVTGVYWGYSVRIAHSIAEIFTKAPYQGGYDLTVGTSDRGCDVRQMPSKSLIYNHLLIVFGGLKGLEAALANDDKLNLDDPELLFDHYVNVVPRQGSRTIRTEEALLVAMAALQEKLQPRVEDIEENMRDLLAQSEDTGGSAIHAMQQQIANVTKKNKKQKQQQQSAMTENVNTEECRSKAENFEMVSADVTNNVQETDLADLSRFD